MLSNFSTRFTREYRGAVVEQTNVFEIFLCEIMENEKIEIILTGRDEDLLITLVNTVLFVNTRSNESVQTIKCTARILTASDEKLLNEIFHWHIHLVQCKYNHK